LNTAKDLLTITNLTTSFRIKDTYHAAVDDVSLSLQKNEVLAIVGESGCGKSTLATTIVGLHNEVNTKVTGDIFYNNQNLAKLNDQQFNNLRGNDIGFIFQDPLSALNPLMRISEQIEEGLIYHTKLSKQQRSERVLELLNQVGIANPERVARQFPHQLSGGMRQRVMIAIALSCKPAILIADEPTTALDVTIQAQILDLLKALQTETETGIILITHDLGVVAEMADRVMVMYYGQIVEEAHVKAIYKNPQHPYTIGLLNSIPSLEDEQDKLQPIEGNVPNIGEVTKGCPFFSRCAQAHSKCFESNPPLIKTNNEHSVRCWLYSKEEVFA